MQLMFEEVAESPSYASMSEDSKVVVRCISSSFRYFVGWLSQSHRPKDGVAEKFEQIVRSQESEAFLFELTRQMPWEVVINN